MKRIILSLLLGLLGMGGTFHAQVPIPLPNSSFEQWDNHSGYNVTVLFFNLPVYSDYTTPSGWNYPAYPVNQSVSFMGMTVNINTSVPVVLATLENTAVPNGNTAVKLQTLMIDDIVSSTVLNLAGSSIDSSLTSQVIPSILTTGQVDIDAMIPIISSLLSGNGDVVSMLPTLLAMDVNDFITGGIPLNGLRPGLLTGSYKFHSAIGGDNGGVIMLGTHYNAATHQRDIVGLGMNLALIDTSVYTPFEVEYLPLSAYMPGSPNVQPDSLIVAIFSSANANLQQGSSLWVDNLALWSAPDTCADVNSLAAVSDIHEAELSWSVNDSVDEFEIEYGPAGFVPGSGIVSTTTTTSVTLSALDAGTLYDVYVRTLCSDTIYGDWSTTQFTTLSDTCATVLDLMVQNVAYDAFPMMVLQWYGNVQPDHWEVEYGPQGFALGTGTREETEETTFEIYTLEESGVLNPNTWYDFYVRSVCHDDVYGEWDSVQYLTFCADVGAVAVSNDNLAATADNRISGYSIAWEDNSDNRSWGVYYGIYNPEYPDFNWGTHVSVDTQRFDFPPLNPGVTYSVEITPYCGDGNYGNTKWINFTTATLTGIGTFGDSKVGCVVYPNPANGQCVVSLPAGQPAELRLFSLDGRLLQTVAAMGGPVVLQLPWSGVFLPQATTPVGTLTKKIVNE